MRQPSRQAKTAILRSFAQGLSAVNRSFLPPLAALSAALLSGGFAQAQSGDAGGDGPVGSVRTVSLFGYESVRLPEGERLGLVGGTLLFDVGDGWAFGPGVYGGASGRRGGFFVAGVEVQHRWSIAAGWTLASGFYAGGGGGAAAPVGSGLMLRPAVTLLKDLGPALQLGLSLSSVRFPSGDIASEQAGIALAWRGEFLYLGGEHGASGSVPGRATGLGFDRMALTASTYRFDGSVRPTIGLAGARAERRTAYGLAWGLEAAAAAKGDAAGYMEILGTLGADVAPWPELLRTWRVGVRAAAGLGGGGAVPTGGGLIGKAAATMSWSPAPGWTLGAELGRLRAAEGGMQARQAQLWLGVDLEPGYDGRSTEGRVVRTEWAAVVQHHARVKRSDGRRQSLDTIGLKLNRFVDANVYLSGQAHSAYAGSAGAYSVGLVGAGVASVTGESALRFGAEALAGAAGGGGVDTQGGAILQAVLWAGWNATPRSEWRLGLGTMQTLRDRHGTPLVELAWSRAFGMAGW